MQTRCDLTSILVFIFILLPPAPFLKVAGKRQDGEFSLSGAQTPPAGEAGQSSRGSLQDVLSFDRLPWKPLQEEAEQRFLLRWTEEDQLQWQSYIWNVWAVK